MKIHLRQQCLARMPDDFPIEYDRPVKTLELRKATGSLAKYVRDAQRGRSSLPSKVIRLPRSYRSRMPTWRPFRSARTRNFCVCSADPALPGRRKEDFPLLGSGGASRDRREEGFSISRIGSQILPIRSNKNGSRKSLRRWPSAI